MSRAIDYWGMTSASPLERLLKEHHENYKGFFSFYCNLKIKSQTLLRVLLSLPTSVFKQTNIYNFSNYIQVKIIRIVIVRGDTLNAFLLMSAAKTN